jgi:hypothetical protein
MQVQAPPEQLPIRTDADGVIRVGDTRVTLDTLVAASTPGRPPRRSCSSILGHLASAYSVIAHYLRHRAEVRAYLALCQHDAALVRRESERRFDPAGVRDRLLAPYG